MIYSTQGRHTLVYIALYTMIRRHTRIYNKYSIQGSHNTHIYNIYTILRRHILVYITYICILGRNT